MSLQNKKHRTHQRIIVKAPHITTQKNVIYHKTPHPAFTEITKATDHFTKITQVLSVQKIGTTVAPQY